MNRFNSLDRNAYYVLDDEGNHVPANFTEWIMFCDNKDNRRPALDRFESVAIFTYFSGLDRFNDGSKPLLWHTEIAGGPLDGALYANVDQRSAMLFHDLLKHTLPNWNEGDTHFGQL
jgi:hypothetical protein